MVVIDSPPEPCLCWNISSHFGGAPTQPVTELLGGSAGPKGRAYSPWTSLQRPFAKNEVVLLREVLIVKSVNLFGR